MNSPVKRISNRQTRRQSCLRGPLASNLCGTSFKAVKVSMIGGPIYGLAPAANEFDSRCFELEVDWTHCG